MENMQKNDHLITTIVQGFTAALITAVVALSAVGAIMMNPWVAPVLMLAFKAVALAMAVAVIVLNAQRKATVSTSISLLALGLFCLAVTSMM